MTTDSVRHVVYREQPSTDGGPQWHSYSFPHAVYVAAPTLLQARDEFREAARFAIDGFDEAPSATEHLERRLVDDIFVRTAVDRHLLDRDAAAATMRRALTHPTQRADLDGRGPLSGHGDVIVVACVAGDTIAWVIDQMSGGEALVVATQIGDDAVAWSFLAGVSSSTDTAAVETLAEAGLELDATIAELMVNDASASGRRVSTLAGR